MTIQTGAADACFDIIMLREAMLLPGKLCNHWKSSLPLLLLTVLHTASVGVVLVLQDGIVSCAAASGWITQLPLQSEGSLVVLCPRGIAGRDDIVVVWQGKKEEEED